MLRFEGLKVDARGKTDVGRVRRVNQDQFLIAALHKVIDIHETSLPAQYHQQFDSGARALLLLVADGVGGGPGGERASSLTLDAIMQYVTTSMRCFYKLDQVASLDLMSELAASVHSSHLAVRTAAEAEPDDSGMATTLTMAHILWPRAYVVHIGDSRCYHVRGGRLELLTRDQTLSQAMVETGNLTAEQAEQSPYAHVLMQAVGGAHDIEPALSQVDLEIDDALLLCTDGLTKHVAHDEIGRLAHAAPDAGAACDALVAAALDGGGTDNVTALVARFGRGD